MPHYAHTLPGQPPENWELPAKIFRAAVLPPSPPTSYGPVTLYEAAMPA
jgi:hypothetical protein